MMDLTSWVSPLSLWKETFISNGWFGVTYGNGIFVAVSYNGISRVMTSSDGTNWTLRTAAEQNTWMSITYGNGLFVAVSWDGQHRVMTSPDGITWTARMAAAQNQWECVAYGNGIFVALAWNGVSFPEGRNTVMVSSDGINWTQQYVNLNQFICIAYGNGIFVGRTAGGRFATSSNGVDWNISPNTYDAPLRYSSSAMTYGNNLFVTVSSIANEMLVSSDGINWTIINSGVSILGCTSVAYGNGIFIAVGNNGARVSPNGINWKYETIRIIPMYSIIYGNNSFVVVGPNWASRATILTPTINTFLIPAKTYGNSPFTITPPTSNSSGSFVYTSSDTSISDISGNIMRINGAGTSLITATQSKTLDYAPGIVTTIFQVNKSIPTIHNFSISIKTYGDPPFEITPPTSNSSGLFSYESSDVSIATILENTLEIIGAGSTTITAFQEESSNYTSGSVTAILQVNKLIPTIENFLIQTKTFGDEPFYITQPSSNSEGLFSYSSSNESVATIFENMITIVGVGTTSIIATQSEIENYATGTAITTFRVNPIPTIQNFSIPIKTYGDPPFMITTPTSNSTGLFSYTSSNESVAIVSENFITIIGAGTAEITAVQEMSENYGIGRSVTTFHVNKSLPTITQFSFPIKTYGDNSFEINPPTSNSVGSFTYESMNPEVATVFENIVTIIGVGFSTIVATQEETDNYTSGSAFSVLQVNPPPTIQNFSVPIKTYGDESFQIIQPVSNSDGSFTYTSSNQSVAIVTGNTLTIVGAGTSTITAVQSVTSNYGSGMISTIFQVNKLEPTVQSFSIPTKSYTRVPFSISHPVSNSPGLFVYNSSDHSVAVISENSVTIVGVGTSIIEATQLETDNYTSKTVTTPLQVVRASPTINFSIPMKTDGNFSFEITPPTSDSDGEFNYTSSNQSVATIFENTMNIIGLGSSEITAFQAETRNYTSGTATALFHVNKSSPTTPTVIDSIDEFLYFLNTPSIYCNLTNSIEIDNDLIVSTHGKVFVGNNITITKSGN